MAEFLSAKGAIMISVVIVWGYARKFLTRFCVLIKDLFCTQIDSTCLTFSTSLIMPFRKRVFKTYVEFHKGTSR